MKKAIDNYLTNHIKIPYVQFNEIGLGPIARKASNEDIILFLELVFFVIIHCPQKETYIRRIMELDEKSQYFLMLFIKKSLGESKDDVIQDTELNKKEIEILRNEKIRISEQFLEMQNEFNKVRELKDKLAKENDELKLGIIDLQSEISQSPNKHESENTEIYHRLEKKLAQKSQLLEASEESLKGIRLKYEAEISQLRDELDISHAKNYQINQLEKTLENYKKKVEKMTAMKKRVIDLKRHNDNMQQLIIEHQNEIETYQQYKKSSIFYKEEYNKEKEKYDNAIVALEMKEKHHTKLNKIILEMSDKILYQENRIHELEIPLDSSFASEDSFNYGKIDSDQDFKKMNRFNSGNMQAGPNSTQTEILAKEINSVKAQLQLKKNHLARCKETINMQNEEMLSKTHYTSMLITQLSSRNAAMADKLQSLSEEISTCEHEQEKYKQVIYEFNNMKSYKDSLLSEIKNLYEEKDLIYKKYVSGREEVIMLNNKLHEKDFIAKDLQLALQLLTEKSKNHENSEPKNMVRHEDNPEKFSRIEESLKALVQENHELSMRIKEKDERIEALIKDKTDTLAYLDAEHKENICRLKYEYDWKSAQNIRQTEEALSQIQKEKDELQARLNIEKKSTLLEWKRAMILKDPTLLSSEEASKLKLQIAELEKENEKLLRTNQELTICWKDSARMLKSVSKSVGIETKRMQSLMKQKQ